MSYEQESVRAHQPPLKQTQWSDGRNLHTQNANPCERAATELPHVIFRELVSPRAAGWRGGAALLCSFSPLTGSTFHRSACPAQGWTRVPAVSPAEVSAECARTGPGVLERRSVEILGASVMFATEDCRNLPTCRRDHSLTGALLERRKKWSREWIQSATELTAVIALVLLNIRNATKSLK